MDREEIIRSMIKEKGMSLKSFAESIDMPYTTLHSMLERGIGKAAVDNVIKVCKALNITVEELEELSLNVSNQSINAIAAHAISELNEEQAKEVLKFAQFIKSQESKK